MNDGKSAKTTLRLKLIALLLLSYGGFSVAEDASALKTCPSPEMLFLMANTGDSAAQFVVGLRQSQAPNLHMKDAVQMLQRSAEQGHRGAQLRLGVLLFDGGGVDKDPINAGKWLLRAAEQGSVEAQARLQLMYTEGIGVPKDRYEASNWRFRTLSNREKTLTSIAAAGSSLPATQGRATIADYLPFAEAGSALAQYQLGRLYFDAPYGERDEELGLKWMTRAARQGHSRAMMDVGKILALGAKGIEPDQDRAVQWFRSSAKQDFRRATVEMVNVSFLIGTGLPTEAREAKMFSWTMHIAELGSDDAQFRLGHMFASEKGVPQDYGQAAYWYQRAAEQGNVEAQYELARLYVDGLGVTRNVNTAYFWWTLASRGGRKGGALAAPEFWTDKLVQDIPKIEEEVNRWKPNVRQATLPSVSKLEILCL